MVLTRSFSEPPEGFGAQPLRAREAERAASTCDLDGCISRKHFHDGPAPGSMMSSHMASIRHATMDIDSCSRRKRAPDTIGSLAAVPEGSGLRGWRHTSYDVPARAPARQKHFWQPFGPTGYDGVSNSSRRAIFDQSVRAEEYAMLLGRPISHREHPRACLQRNLKEHRRQVAVRPEQFPSPLGLRRMLSSLLPQDSSEVSRQLQAAAELELTRQGVAIPSRMCGAPRTHERRGSKVETEMAYSTASAQTLREQAAGPTLLRSVARHEKHNDKTMPQKSFNESDAVGGVADLLLQHSQHLRQESVRLMAKAEELEQQAAGQH